MCAAGGAYSTTQDKALHDALVTAVPQARGWMRPGAFRSGEFELGTRYRLTPLLTPFTRAVREPEAMLTYQTNISRNEGQREDLRWLRKRIARMEIDGRIPSRVIALQNDLVEGIGDRPFVAEEFVACDPITWGHVSRVVDEAFVADRERFGFADSPLDTDNDVIEDALTLGITSDVLGVSSPMARAAAAVSATELLNLLRWKPPARDIAPTPAGGGAHAFISYSSVDDAASATVRDSLETNGVPCWIAPRDISAGLPYPDAIMTGLQRSRLVVLVLSRDAIASPHVQREIERAVSLRRPILTLRIDDSDVSPFFQYLLSVDQWIDGSNPPAEAALQRLVATARQALAATA
jgi:hypothetical protein